MLMWWACGGGEALLNKEIEPILNKCAGVFSTSRIELGTNGLLLERCEASLLATIKKYNVKIVISGYPPTMERWKPIKEMLELLGIKYKYSEVGKFFRRYNPKGIHDISDNYRRCGSKICHTVANGRFSSCYFPISAHIFNDYFEEYAFKYEDAVFNLYDEKLTREEFCRIIKSENQCCRYCDEPQMETWSNNKSKILKEDWLKQ